MNESSRIAKLQLGDEPATPRLEPGAPRLGWHSRGYLPHFESTEVIQHVTYHLADSLPKDVIDRLDRELKHLPPKSRDLERRKRVEAWMDAGHGSCVLKEPAIAAMVQDTFLFFDAQRYRLFAWVVMPNHVHVLFQPLPGWTMAKIVASWKSYTGRRISEWQHRTAKLQLGDPSHAKLQLGDPSHAKLQLGDPSQPAKLQLGDTSDPAIILRGSHQPAPRLEPGAPNRIWQREYWDRYMRDEEHFLQTVEYIHYNPVKAGLVLRPEDWPWSSAYARLAKLELGDPLLASLEPGAPGTAKLQLGSGSP